jgi:hypothetical protein
MSWKSRLCRESMVIRIYTVHPRMQAATTVSRMVIVRLRMDIFLHLQSGNLGRGYINPD